MARDRKAIARAVFELDADRYRAFKERCKGLGLTMVVALEGNMDIFLAMTETGEDVLGAMRGRCEAMGIPLVAGLEAAMKGFLRLTEKGARNE